MAENESKKPTGAYVVKDVVTNVERNITVFTINGNLTEFTQWEQGYSLTNPNMKAGDAVQFFSGAGDGSIMTAKEEGGVVLVEVPNIMLKHASNITARFVGGGDYTSFAVIGRKRPKGYVFIDNEYKEETPSSGGGGNSTYNVEYIVGEAIKNGWYNGGGITKVDFPLVTVIDRSAFNGFASLTEANLPLATSIGSYAFDGCTSLTEANLPLATSIGSYAFNGCTSLTKVDFPNVTSIENSAFSGCEDLTTADFPNVTNIGGRVFYGCIALKSLILRTTETVCVIDLTAFDESAFLINSNTGLNNGNIYVPTVMYEYYRGGYEATLNGLLGEGAFERIVRKLEDYTIDGTVTGELDESKI